MHSPNKTSMSLKIEASPLETISEEQTSSPRKSSIDDFPLDKAYRWLKQDAMRHFYVTRDVYMNVTNNEITGKLLKYNGKVGVGARSLFEENHLDFTIHNQNGGSEVYVFLSGDVGHDKPYRVYHEDSFSKEAVFPLRKIILAKTHLEAAASGWFNKRKKAPAQFEFYIAFLRQEILECEGDKTFVRAIRKIMAPYIAAVKKAKAQFYKTRHHTPKQPKQTPPQNTPEQPDYGPVAALLMAKMGFKEGMGLGKAEDGIREPVMAKVGPKKAGLGFDGPKRPKHKKMSTGKSEVTTAQESAGLLDS